MATSFNITIHNWDKHNGGKKKNHRYFLFENRFFQDHKIAQLKPIHCLCFVNLLCIASDLNASAFTITSRSLAVALRLTGSSLVDALESLQRFQLLSYEKIDSFKKTIEENTIENNTTEEKESGETAAPETPPTPPKKPSKKTSELFEPTSAEELKTILGTELINDFKALYKDEGFVDHEIAASLIWCKSEHKTRRSKKGWDSFVAGWLKRGWDWKQKSNAGNPRSNNNGSNNTARTYQNQRTDSENDFFRNGSETLIGGK